MQDAADANDQASNMHAQREAQASAATSRWEHGMPWDQNH